MKIKVSAGFSGKIPTGEYQNAAPSFFAEMEWDPGDERDCLKADYLEREINNAQKHLHDICYKNFQVVADRARLEKIKADMKGFRFYHTEHGEYPSVTTINDPTYSAWVGDAELRILASEGNIMHARIAHFIKTGVWEDPKALEGVANDILVCKGRFLDYFDFPGFLGKYPLKDLKNGDRLVNHEYRYAGTDDAECLYPLGGEKGAEVVPTEIDFKRTPDRDKNFTQISAYAKCKPHIRQMMIIPTHTETAQGFSKPILSTAIDKYFEVFLHKRKEFEKTYGV